MCLFLTIRSNEDRQKWLKWAEDFTNRYPESPIAHYCKGDAMARLKQWMDAISAYDNALTKTKNGEHSLVYNARGVAYAHHNELGNARLDFAHASKSSNGTLADAYANIGALRIQKKDGAEGAKRAFDKALELSSTFALVLHSRGCVQLVLGKTSEAKKDFQEAEKYSTCPGGDVLMAQNRLRIVAYWKGMNEKELLAAIQSGKAGGTTFDASLRDVAKTWDNFKDGAGRMGGQFKYNRFHEQFGKLSSSQQEAFFKNRIAPSLRTDSRLNNIYDQASSKVGGWSKEGANAVADGFKLGGGLTAAIAATHANAPAAAAGVTAAFAGNKFSDWNNKNAATFDRLNDLKTTHLSGRTSGGFDMSLAMTPWDGGEWPFVSYYGLLFSLHFLKTVSG